MKEKSFCVIGGGAAGFFAAIRYAENHPGALVVILEGSRNPLAKVLISGGGRCNVTHHCFEPAELVKSYPRGEKELRGPFTRFGPKETFAWFTQRGVELKTEKDGRVFPVTDDSQTIADCLQQAARERGVEVRLGVRVRDITRKEEGLCVAWAGGGEETFDRVLLATGGTPSGYQLAQKLGHTLSPPVPSLFTFNIQDPRLQDLAGISFPEVSLELVPQESARSKPFRQKGPLLITHWGLSGPAVLKLSAWAARELHASSYQAQLKINFFAEDRDLASVEKFLLQHKEKNHRSSLIKTPPLPFPKRFWSGFLAHLGGEEWVESTPWSQMGKKDLQRLGQELTGSVFQVRGKGVFKEEFVTCGGIPLKEVQFKTMESRVCPGLYLAGEILDIDGITGGFNFQNAWTTGWIAGTGAGTGGD